MKRLIMVSTLLVLLQLVLRTAHEAIGDMRLTVAQAYSTVSTERTFDEHTRTTRRL